MDEGRIRRVEDMPVYQLFYSLALKVQKTSRDWPHAFQWLRSQSLRSSESVCANMTEGFYAQYSTEYLQCLYRCRREARETQTHLKYGTDVEVLEKSLGLQLVSEYQDGLQQLANLILSIENKIMTRGKSKPFQVSVKEDSACYELEEAFHQPLTINH